MNNPATGQSNRLLLMTILPGLLWSTVFPLSKWLLQTVPPTTLVAVRFSVGAACLLLFAVYRYSWAAVRSAGRRRWPSFLLLGFFGFFTNNFLQNLGLNLSTASSASLLSTTDPIFTALLSALILKETLTGRKLLGLTLSFFGVYLVTTNGQWAIDSSGGLGNVLVIASAIGYSVYTVFSKRLLHAEEPPIVVAWSTAVGALLLLVAALLMDPPTSWTQLSGSELLILSYLSIVPTVVPVVIYSYLLRQVQASQAAITLFLIPAFSLIWSVLLLHERLTWPMLLGGALILSGVALSLNQGRRAARQVEH
ncbi:MAG: DMT family transporter [Bacillota bacterium]|jgi:drug/metabolite transporter (DMT)-like permease